MRIHLLSCEKNTTTYRPIYEGAIFIWDPEMPSVDPYPDYSNVYYRDNIGFEITGTHKLAQDKPTVTIRIPADMLNIDRKR